MGGTTQLVITTVLSILGAPALWLLFRLSKGRNDLRTRWLLGISIVSLAIQAAWLVLWIWASVKEVDSAPIDWFDLATPFLAFGLPAFVISISVAVIGSLGEFLRKSRK